MDIKNYYSIYIQKLNIIRRNTNEIRGDRLNEDNNIDNNLPNIQNDSNINNNLPNIQNDNLRNNNYRPSGNSQMNHIIKNDNKDIKVEPVEKVQNDNNLNSKELENSKFYNSRNNDGDNTYKNLQKNNDEDKGDKNIRNIYSIEKRDNISIKNDLENNGNMNEKDIDNADNDINTSEVNAKTHNNEKHEEKSNNNNYPQNKWKGKYIYILFNYL